MFKKLMAGVILAAVSVTALVPAAVSAAPGTTIVDKAIAVNSRTGDYDTLLTAATCDYLGGAVVDVLSSPDKTLFAPTDAAFRRLGDALGLGKAGLNPSNVCSVDSLLGDGVLLDILAYHVIDGKVNAKTAVSAIGSKVEMLNGDKAENLRARRQASHRRRGHPGDGHPRQQPGHHPRHPEGHAAALPGLTATDSFSLCLVNRPVPSGTGLIDSVGLGDGRSAAGSTRHPRGRDGVRQAGAATTRLGVVAVAVVGRGGRPPPRDSASYAISGPGIARRRSEMRPGVLGVDRSRPRMLPAMSGRLDRLGSRATPARCRSMAAAPSNWSLEKGMTSRGTPWVRASVTLLLPPCVTSRDACSRSATWGRLARTSQSDGERTDALGTIGADGRGHAGLDPVQCCGDPRQDVAASRQEGAERHDHQRSSIGTRQPGCRLVVGRLVAHGTAQEGVARQECRSRRFVELLGVGVEDHLAVGGEGIADGFAPRRQRSQDAVVGIAEGFADAARDGP